MCVPAATSGPRCVLQQNNWHRLQVNGSEAGPGDFGWLLWLVGLDGRIYDRHASTLCHSATDSGLQQPSCNPILMKKWSRVDGITLLQTGFADAPYKDR